MKKVSFIIELQDRISKVAANVKASFSEMSAKIGQATSQTKRFSDVCNNLKMPHLNALVQVVERMGTHLDRAAQTGMSVGQSMADLSAITGIAGDELAALEASSRRFGVESGMGADVAARAFTLLASQIDVAKIGMDGLMLLEEKSITLAHASGMSLDGAATALAGTINQFGLGADAADQVINVLAAGSKYGAAEIEELSQSFKVVGAAASAMGLNVESTAGALEVLSKANLKGSEAGTALRNIILKLNTTLGVDLGETSLGTALEALKPKLDDAAFLSKVFGMENIAAAQFLIQNAAAVDEMTQKLTDTSVAEEQAAIRTQTTAQRMAELRAKVDDLKIGFANALGNAAPFVSVLSENADAVALAAAGVGRLMSGLSWLNGVVVKLTGSTILQKAATVAVTVATKVWTGVQAALNAVMSANPIALVVLALAALAAGVVYAYHHCEGFRQVCDKVWATTKQLAQVVWDYLVRAFEAVTGAVKKAWEWMKKFLGIKDKPQEVSEALDEETASIEANTQAKKANAAIKLDFSKFGSVGAALPVAQPKTYKELADAVSYYEKALQALQPSEQATMALMQRKVAAYKAAQSAIEQQWAAATRPDELNTLQAIEEELAYLTGLRSRATAEQLAGIEAEIRRLNELRAALEEAGHTEVGVEQIRTYAQLEEEMAFYEGRMKRATVEERAQLQARVVALRQLKNEWDAAPEAMEQPAPMEQLNTLAQLDDAVAYYSRLQKRATAEEIGAIQQTIDALEGKREALLALASLPSRQQEVTALEGLAPEALRLKLELIGLEGVRSRLQELQLLLDQVDSPLNEQDRAAVEGLVAAWSGYEAQLSKTMSQGDVGFGLSRSEFDAFTASYVVADGTDIRVLVRLVSYERPANVFPSPFSGSGELKLLVVYRSVTANRISDGEGVHQPTMVTVH